ncbi:class I SAM-dependent methyltransferase [Mycobacterium heidelbergense]|uniref:class I SAM-dependent methyltransferase n=1 Tax=Mycobacterium heidelbergense TaxID=53376 RepID=UPI001E62B73F|nr:class I SAM-dependent methyltransferase [Mycobacterium heidelbergense]
MAGSCDPCKNVCANDADYHRTNVCQAPKRGENMPHLSVKILPANVLNTIKRARPIYAVARRARFAAGSLLGARTLPGLDGRVHYNDFMLGSSNPADVQVYHRIAQEIVSRLGRSLNEAGRDWDTLGSVLEVGCGYGRIVRELRNAVPADRIYVSDVIDEGARFTASEFGAKQIPADPGPEWDGRFDLIYLLSVYSHMHRLAVADHLRRMQDLLAPGGVLVFTTHGRFSAENLEEYEHYWLDKSQVLDALADAGYYFERYPYYYDEYGMTWFTQEAVESLVAESAPALESVSCHLNDVAGQQDFYVWRKSDAA